MEGPTPSAWRQSALWLVLAIAAVVILMMRLQLSFDLSAFFPRHTTLAHDVLLEQLRNGPGSRLLVIGISGAPRDRLEEASDSLRRELESKPLFTTVQNGEFADTGEDIPGPVNSYYLLLDDVDYSRASLERALQSRLQDLAFGGGGALLDLISRDPFLLTLDVLERLAPVDMSGETWMAENGSAVLMATTRAPSIDLEAQAAAVAAVQTAFIGLEETSALDLEITGVGAFGVELQNTIRAEARTLSILAASALCLVLLLVYRSPRLLLLSALPIGMGFLLGLAAVSLFFASVHGITLAFGFTLLGVAIDYPLHLFSHARRNGRAATASIWPTMRLGALSTAVAYLALAMSGSEGLAQLGVFTAVGVTVAALVTRYWLPQMLPQRPSPVAPPGEMRKPVLHFIPAVAVAAALLALFTWHYDNDPGLWDDRLSTLSPVPEQRLQMDMALRSAAGTPDMRYQLVMHDESLESLLVRSEAMELHLAEAAGDGLLRSWRSVSQLLPSHQRQASRQHAIPAEAILQARVSDVVADTPFRAQAFAPFVAAAAAARKLSPLGPEDLAGTLLQPWLDSHLLKLEDQWVALTSISEPDAEALAERVANWGAGVLLVDLQQSSAELMGSYRSGAITTVSFAALAIVVLIWLQRRQLAQILWIVLTVAGALGLTFALVSFVHGQLTVIHLVASLLVLGLGLDYALFLSRSEDAIERGATNQAVLACALSTTLAFGILATSSIPVLQFIGFTVAVGSATSYLLALAGSRL